MFNPGGKRHGHTLSTNVLIFMLACGCANRQKLRLVQAKEEQIQNELLALTKSHAEVSKQRDCLQKVVEADPDKAAVVKLHETEAQLEILTDKLRTSMSENESIYTHAKQLQARLAPIQNDLLENASSKTLKNAAVSYVKKKRI